LLVELRFELLKLNINLVFQKSSKPYIRPLPFKCMRNKNYYSTLLILSAVYALTGCGILGKKDKGSALANDGQLHGVAPGS